MLKIKVYIIILAWLLLSLHSIIPHNHFQASLSGCQELIHKHSTENKDCDLTSDINSQPEESTVCHFSGLLFNNDNPDNLLFFSNKDTCHYHLQLITAVFMSATVDYVTDPYRGTSSLRAPPAG